MKLSNTDYILLFNNIVLITIFGILYYKLEYESGIFINNSEYIKFCKDQQNYDWELKALLANKIKVKKFNEQYFPELKQAKVLYNFDLTKIKEDKYDYTEKVNFDELSSNLPDKYIIKCSVGGANHHIVKKNNIKELKENCDHILYYYIPRIVRGAKENNQLQHLKYEPELFIEEYLGDNLIDYKFQLINNRLFFLMVKNAWKPDMCKFYDNDGNYLPNLFHWPGETNEMKLPKNFEKMKAFCHKFYELTKIKYIRIDFYEINDEIYFGEYTISSGACRNKVSKNVDNYFKKFNNNNI